MKVYAIFIITLIILSCSKVELEDGNNRLPRATERGRGIFACYIDDQTYIAKRQDAITYNTNTGYLFLENANEDFEFRLFIYKDVFGPGLYQFDNTGEEWVSTDYVERYGVKPSGINQIQITKLDLTSKIVAGTFNVDLISADSTEKMVRNGRFDLEMEFVQ